VLVNSSAPQAFDGLTVRRRDDTTDRCLQTSLGLQNEIRAGQLRAG
jgi:hypothetical protein